MLNCVDVSNYTGTLTPEALQRWKAVGVELVIVQAVDPPPGYPPGVTVQQLRACRDAGMPVDVYLYLWTWGDAKADMRAKLALVEASGVTPRKVWLDVEDTAAAESYQRIQQLAAALTVVDPWCAERGVPRPGIYSARWYWPTYMSDTTEFADRDLWDAQYDGEPDAETGWQPYGGWTERRIKQYRGSTSLEGVGGIDLNVLSVAEEAELTGGTIVPINDFNAREVKLIEALGYLHGDWTAKVRAELDRRGAPRKRVLRALLAEHNRVAGEALA